jgi:hypothetical protein
MTLFWSRQNDGKFKKLVTFWGSFQIDPSCSLMRERLTVRRIRTVQKCPKLLLWLFSKLFGLWRPKSHENAIFGQSQSKSKLSNNSFFFFFDTQNSNSDRVLTKSRLSTSELLENKIKKLGLLHNFVLGESFGYEIIDCGVLWKC